MAPRRLAFARLLLSLVALAGMAPARAATWMLDEMTSPELQQRIDGGATTVLVPIGGTEQNGPHMVLGKHNVRVKLLAGRIAERLGNAVVAPVVNYVPEGRVQPPTQHMRWAGTISVPESAFEAVLDGAARSFRQHGFRAVVFLGDHGGYQKSVERVALRLDREFAPSTRVLLCADYYRTAQAGLGAALRARGFSDAAIGTHAGLADTALAWAVEPSLVRSEVLAKLPAGALDGVAGDPRAATAELGLPGTERIVDASVAAIRQRLRAGN